MRRVESEADFRQLVRERYDDLTPQQELIARYLLDHVREAPFLSVPELAKNSGASEATVVRFAQRLGYSGFSGLKMDLLDALREQVIAGDRPPGLAGDERGEGIEPLATVARQEIANVERTLRDLDRGVFRQLAASLFKADHVFTFGLGISSYGADLMAYFLAEIGLRSSVLSTRFSSPLEQLVPLRPTDLLVAFSFPPYSRSTLEVLEKTVERGIPTIAICDREAAPAARVADQYLAVRSDNQLFTNSFGALATMLNALVTEIAVRHQDQAFEALSRINRILDEDRGLIEG